MKGWNAIQETDDSCLQYSSLYREELSVFATNMPMRLMPEVSLSNLPKLLILHCGYPGASHITFQLN